MDAQPTSPQEHIPGPPSENKRNYMNISLIAIIIAFVGVCAFVLGRVTSKPEVQKTSVSLSPTQNALSSPTTVPTALPTNEPTTNLSDVTAQENVIYLGTFKGEHAIFQLTPGSTTDGFVMTDKEYGSYAKYSDISAPQHIYENAQYKDMQLLSLIYNVQKTKIYFSFAYTGNGEINKHDFAVLEVDLASKQPKLVLDHLNTTKSNLYGSDYGPAYLNFASANYIVFKKSPCYECDNVGPDQVFVLNMDTNNISKLGIVGEPSIDLQAKTITTKKVIPIQEPCQASPFCENGKMTVYKPEGEQTTTTLP